MQPQTKGNPQQIALATQGSIWAQERDSKCKQVFLLSLSQGYLYLSPGSAGTFIHVKYCLRKSAHSSGSWAASPPVPPLGCATIQHLSWGMEQTPTQNDPIPRRLRGASWVHRMTIQPSSQKGDIEYTSPVGQTKIVFTGDDDSEGMTSCYSEWLCTRCHASSPEA